MPAVELANDPAVLVAFRERGGGTRRGLREAVNAVGALIQREAATRYGGTRFGFLWAFIEPALFFAVFLGLRTLIRDSVPFGESALVFLMSGLITVRASLAIARRPIGVLRGSAALLTFPMVQPIDLVIARIVVEILTMGTVMLVFYALVVGTSDAVRINDFAQFIYAVGALFVLGAGVGAFGAVMCVLVPAYKVFFPLLSFPLLILSGVFYVPALLPPFAIEILSWNPVLHCVEWFREAIYLDYLSVLDRSYPLVFGATALWLGLVMVYVFKARLLR